jgi:hypothetical protein
VTDFELKPPSMRRKGRALNAQSPGEPPQEAPITVSAWSGRTPDDAAASYHMVAIWDEVPSNPIAALVEEGVGAGTYMLTDAAGRKSRWIVKPGHVKAYGDADEVPAEIDDRTDFDRRVEEYHRLRELFEPEPRQENPVIPPPSTDWGKLVMALVPAVQPLVQALVKRLSSPSSPASPAPSSPWAELGAWCEQHGIAPDALREQIEAAIAAASSGGGA